MQKIYDMEWVWDLNADIMHLELPISPDLVVLLLKG